MENIKNSANNTRAKRITRIYNNMQKSNVHVSTPDIYRLKSSAHAHLCRLNRQAEKVGYAMSQKTYQAALKRIREIQTVGQYKNFVEDTKRVAENLQYAVKTGKRYTAYFVKLTPNNG